MIESDPRRNRKVAMYAATFAAVMLALGFASVPLYRIFCQVTGFGGTTQRANAAEAARVKVSDKHISVRFDGNVENGMPWRFGPDQVTEDMRIGERKIAYFTAENLSDKTITGVASFNVEPDLAGLYFKKIQCFCFNQQTLKPHEKVRMPVIYFVDPDILKDPESAATTQITLSYTFHVAAEQAGPGPAPVKAASKTLDRAQAAR